MSVYMREEMKELYKAMEYGRYYPGWFARNFLGIDLPEHQLKILREIWYHDNTILLCSRRVGKTFVSGGLTTVLLAILFPNTRIGLVAPTFRISQVAFSECENIYESSNLVRSMAKTEPKHGNATHTIPFKNGSVIEATPMGKTGDSIRGKGYNYILMDEYAYFSNPNTIIDKVISPMLFTKREAKLNYDPHPMGSFNRLVISSTATFSGTDYHKKVQEFDKKIKNGSDKHTIVSFDYRDGIKSGIFSEDRVLEEYKSATRIAQKTEYENIFVDGSSGYIGYDLINAKVLDKDEETDDDGNYTPPKTHIEFEQPLDEEGTPEFEYILSVDNSSQGDDATVFTLIKLDGKVKRIVRIIAYDDAHIEVKIDKIRELLKNFNVKRIVMDQRHKSITDSLMEYYEYDDGTTGECIIKREDNLEDLKYIRGEYGEDVEYSPMIEIENFTAKRNEERAKHLMSQMEKNRVKMPAEMGLDSKDEVEAYQEIKKAIHEIVSIQPKLSGKYIKYQMPSRRMQKDRFTTIELGVYYADKYLRNSTGESDDIFVGKWG